MKVNAGVKVGQTWKAKREGITMVIVARSGERWVGRFKSGVCHHLTDVVIRKRWKLVE